MGNDRILAIDPKFPLCYVRAHGDVAQLGERSVRNAEARGSIPLISTKKESAGNACQALSADSFLVYFILLVLAQ